LKAESPLIGPYSSLDDYTPFTNGLPPTSQPGADSRKTIMPNGELNWWDCPMPPAKIIFEIKNEDGPGFFKQVDKGDVYYELGGTIKSPIVQYTNPFYKIEIPASPLIPPFVNNGGYDWDSFGFNTPYDLKDGYGPYDFWTIFNRPPNPDVPAADANHPTKVEVYSDNHGEAMVWLNGDSRIVLDDAWKAWDAGDVIATTVVQAMADYPYFRKHPVVTSNEVTKDWTWGKDVKLYIESLSPEMPNPVNPTGWKMAWLFVCDRDRFSAVGEQVEWSIAGYGDPQIIGFLEGTDGVLIDKGTATSVTKPCGPAEIAKFEEFFGAGTYPAAPYGYAVAAIKLYNSFALSADLLARVHDPEGVVVRDKMVNFGSGASYDPMLDAPLADCEYLGLYARPLPEALTDIEPYVQAVWYYEDSTGTWMRWIPGDFQGYPNRLDTLVPSKDYLFRLSQNCNWNP